MDVRDRGTGLVGARRGGRDLLRAGRQARMVGLGGDRPGQRHGEDDLAAGERGAGAAHHAALAPDGAGPSSAATQLRRTPSSLISTSISSPGWRKTGGSRVAPTPSGVPVAITSP